MEGLGFDEALDYKTQHSMSYYHTLEITLCYEITLGISDINLYRI